MKEKREESELESLVEQSNIHPGLGKNIIQEIHDEYGYGWITIKVVIISFLNMFTNTYVRSYFAMIVIPFQQFYELSPQTLQWLTLFSYWTNIPSFFIVPYIQKYGRYWILNAIWMVDIVGQLLFMIPSFPVSIVGSALWGGTGSIAMALLYNVLLESVPSKRRGFVLNAIWIASSLGVIVPQLLMLITMPNLEPEKLMDTHLVMLSIPGVTLLVNLLFLQDSPRNLILTDKSEEAFEILEEIKGQKLNEFERTVIVNQVTHGANRKTEHKIFDMVERYKFLTFISCIVTITIYMCNQGTSVISSFTIKELQPSSVTNVGHAVITTNILNALEKLAIGLLSFISEFKFLGRLGAMILSLGLAFISLMFFFSFPSSASLILGLIQAFNNLAFNILFIYLAEVYPTSLRDITNTLYKSLGYLSAGCAQPILLTLNEFGAFVPYYFITILQVVCIISIFLMPYETVGVELDQIEEKHFPDQDDLRKTK